MPDATIIAGKASRQIWKTCFWKRPMSMPKHADSKSSGCGRSGAERWGMLVGGRCGWVGARPFGRCVAPRGRRARATAPSDASAGGRLPRRVAAIAHREEYDEQLVRPVAAERPQLVGKQHLGMPVCHRLDVHVAQLEREVELVKLEGAPARVDRAIAAGAPLLAAPVLAEDAEA
eukprot:7100787-Prymnesium_polylepis.1